MTDDVFLYWQEAINNDRIVDDKAVHFLCVAGEIAAQKKKTATILRLSDMKFILDNIENSLNGK